MSPLLVITTVLVSAAVILMLVGARGLLVARRAAVRARLERVTRHAYDFTGAEPEAVTAGRRPSPARRALGALSRLARPGKARELGRLRLGLTRAGLRGESALEIYLGVKILLAFGLALAVLSLRVLAGPAPGYRFEMLAVVLAAIGFYAPNVWLRLRTRHRQRAIARALPDALDLLVTCVEAGLALEAALVRITREIGLSSPLLAAELKQTTLELQAGVPRAECFHRLAERTGLDDLKSLSATLVQTEMFGTSIARSLRVHATTMRRDRTHRAEERAATVAVKLVVPLILCILPSLIAVIMAPALVRVVRLLAPDIAGGAP